MRPDEVPTDTVLPLCLPGPLWASMGFQEQLRWFSRIGDLICVVLDNLALLQTGMTEDAVDEDHVQEVLEENNNILRHMPMGCGMGSSYQVNLSQ